MNYLTVLMVSAALGIDALSVAISIGLAAVERVQMVAVTSVVIAFHIMMPLIGLYMGTYLGSIAGPIAGSIGALVLITIGLSTLWKWIKEQGIPNKTYSPVTRFNISSPVSLFLMGASVSLDALTVGFGLGTLKVDLLLTVITMGLVAGLMTMFGLVFGKKLSSAFGEKAEIVGGLILVVIGIKLLIG